jgi:hypothetical protein
MDSGLRAERSPPPGPRLQDAVSLLEIAPPQAGGVRESALPGDRAQHPPAPQPAPRIARANSVLFIAVLSIFTAVLAVAFFLLLVALFQLG